QSVAAAALAAALAVAVFALVAWWRPAPSALAGGGTPAGTPSGTSASTAFEPGGWPRVLLVLARSGGGTGVHVAGLARWLRQAGAGVRVAAPPDADQAFGLAATGADVRDVDIADRPRPCADLVALRSLRQLAAGSDVVHAHGLRAGALAVLAARARRRRPAVVVTVHNAVPVPAPQRAAGRPGAGAPALREVAVRAAHGTLARIVARGADHVLVVSGDLGDRMRALGARHVERALVPAPARTPVADGATTRARLGLGSRAWLVVTVARLAPQKGLEVLLDALALLRHRPVRAVVAGDGPLRAELAARINRDVLPVRLLGRRDDVADLLAAADVVVVPSAWEGQPLIVQEALRAGAAIVATDVGGVAEVAGDGALLVPPGDPRALAETLAGLLDDPLTAGALRARARARATQLPTEHDAGSQVLAIYRGLAGSRPARRADPFRPSGGQGADTLEARGITDS
ncbi:MAG TPA: glycosyltransferase family 4 protein, partial [Kineosporiaceae bacterium]